MNLVYRQQKKTMKCECNECFRWMDGWMYSINQIAKRKIFVAKIIQNGK